jgi:uncharacterized membrane protein YcaP (DUF421 family)
MSTIEAVFGTRENVDALQMGARALVVFWIALVLVRVAGMRAFGRKSSFDTIIVIMLGAVLSRAVTGASPFWPTVTAATVLVVVHRLVAMGVARWHRFERALKGHHHILYQDGEIDTARMRRAGISHADLEEAVRAQLHGRSLEEAGAIYLESSGELTVVARAR